MFLTGVFSKFHILLKRDSRQIGTRICTENVSSQSKHENFGCEELLGKLFMGNPTHPIRPATLWLDNQRTPLPQVIEYPMAF
jgi:hypothetical protein